jgi:hypothetical protein
MTIITVTVDGVETALSSLGALVGHVGWGMPPVDSYLERAPGQHGDTPAGYSLAPRIGQLVFKMPLADLDAMYTLRSELLTLFSPVNSIILKFTTLEGARCFDCRYVGEMGFDWDVGDWAAQKFVVALKSNDPTCYDPAGQAWNFGLGGGADTMLVPTVIPMTVGGSTINVTSTITYAGNWLSYPFIRITGPIHDAVIENQTTGDILDFTGVTIDAAHYYDIDCRYGHKTVIDNHGTNKIADLTAASDLATFHLEENTINSIRVTGSAVTEATIIQLSYFERWLGV